MFQPPLSCFTLLPTCNINKLTHMGGRACCRSSIARFCATSLFPTEYCTTCGHLSALLPRRDASTDLKSQFFWERAPGSKVSVSPKGCELGEDCWTQKSSGHGAHAGFGMRHASSKQVLGQWASSWRLPLVSVNLSWFYTDTSPP